MEKYSLMGGKLHVYKRPNSRFFQCSTFLAGKNRRVSTKEEGPSKAKDFAEEWYLELHGKLRAGDIKDGKSFRFAAEQFMREYPIITQGQRNPGYVKRHEDRLRVYLNPFFGDKVLPAITPGMVQEYRVDRMQNPRKGKPPARSTLHRTSPISLALQRTLFQVRLPMMPRHFRMLFWRRSSKLRSRKGA